MSTTIPLPDRVEHPADAGKAGASAFITAPVAVDLRAIRERLERQGFETFTADELDLPGRPLSEILQEGMSRADLVVGVLGGGTSADNVFFELGFAQALGKRTLVLVSGDAPLSGWASSGIPYVRADPSDPQAVEFAVSQLLKIPHHGSDQAESVRRTHPLGAAAGVLLSRLEASPSAEVGRVLEEVVLEAIRQSGIDTAAKAADRSDGIDVAVWFGGL